MSPIASPDEPPLLSVRDLRIAGVLGRSPRTIVAGADLTVERGEAVAIVGESGSGKSLTARAILGVLPRGLAATGEVRYRGRDLLSLGERERRELRGSEMALVLQDPFTMLNPVVRVGRQIEQALCGQRGRRLRARDRREEAIRRLEEVRIDARAAHRYPFQLSGGMRQRVGLAAAIANDPALLIADEPSTALDVTTQAEILALLRSLREARGMSLILITHDLRVAFSSCDRVYVLYAGSLLEVGRIDDVESEPLHPYTLGLLTAEPPVERRLRRLSGIPGTVPGADEVSSCCPFAPRCRWAAGVCTVGRPDLVAIGPGRESRCVRIGDIRGEMEAELVAIRSASSDGNGGGRPGDGGAPVVEIRELAKVFPGGRRGHDVVALDGVTLSVSPGESVALVGESGSGKTTLARCVLGLETPSGGEILVGGARVPSGRGQHGRGGIQVVFQDPYSSLNPALSIRTTLREALAAKATGRVARSAVDGLLEQVGLPAAYGRRKPAALSGGERQRVAIARALAAAPRMIICDEAVSALDVSVQAQILNLLADIRAQTGMAYLFITHDLAVARQATDRMYVLRRGRIVESGTTERVLAAPADPYTRKLIESIPGRANRREPQ